MFVSKYNSRFQMAAHFFFPRAWLLRRSRDIAADIYIYIDRAMGRGREGNGGVREGDGRQRQIGEETRTGREQSRQLAGVAFPLASVCSARWLVGGFVYPISAFGVGFCGGFVFLRPLICRWFRNFSCA